MENEEKVVPMKKTVTAWDSYWDIIEKVFQDASSTYRASDKHMAPIPGKFDTHLTTRLLHQMATASIMGRLAERLGLNKDLAKNGMIGHDNGHPFSAHDGEEIFNAIAEIYNLCYFHHNENGVEVSEADELLKLALNMVPNIDEDEELKQNLIEDFYYIYDIIISHDGEADPKDLSKRPKEYKSIKEAVEDKKTRSKTIAGDYKFVSQTPEGMLGKYADVIAYLSTDFLDGFRLGTFNTPNDDYLEIYGKIISPAYINDRDTAIRMAKARIYKYSDLFLKEGLEGLNNEDPEIKNTVRNILNAIKSKGINIAILTEQKELNKSENYLDDPLKKERDKIEAEVLDIIDEYCLDFGNNKIENSNESIEEIKTDMEKISQFVHQKIFLNSKVIRAMTNDVQQYFIEDLAKNSAGKEIPQLSDYAAELYKAAKYWGYKYYIPETKTKYQKELLPDIVLEIVKRVSKKLLDDKVIEKKLNDKSIKKQIPEEMIPYIENIPKEERDKKAIPEIIHSIREDRRLKRDTKSSKFNIVAKIKDRMYRQDERFVNTYKYTYLAIENQIRAKVEKAISPTYHGIEHTNNKLEEKLEQEIASLREKFFKECPKFKDISGEPSEELLGLKENFIQKLVSQERKKIIEKVAMQVSIDYVAGMTDKGIENLAIDFGLTTREEIDDAFKRERHQTKALTDLANGTAPTSEKNSEER